MEPNQLEDPPGVVDEWVDARTGLHVFSYNTKAAVHDRWAGMCRGLVLHPSSSSIVATPFARFFDIDFGQAVTDATPAVGTPKLDGSMVCAFVWQG